MKCEITYKPSESVFLSRLPDLQVGDQHGQFTAPLFAVSSDGAKYRFEFHFEGSCYCSVACFQANQLTDLRQAAKTRFLEVIDVHLTQDGRLPILN